MATLRELREQLEEGMLSPYAARSASSRGRERPEDPCPIRTSYQRDRDRIVHCKAFRRLSDKTQVFIAPEGDHYRTRLTHTLEVAQIGRTIARGLRLNEDLAEAIALGHDLGHTPFGHAGESALDAAYRRYDAAAGFLHAEQSLRVVEVLEKEGEGLNLTWEVREGIRNHSKGMDDFPRDTEAGPSTLEGWVVLYADRIAYVNHDIDDALRAGLVTAEALPPEGTAVLGRTHGQRITTMVTDVITHSLDQPRLHMGEEVAAATNGLKDFLYANVYQRANLAGGENERVERTIRSLFDFYMARPEEFPDGAEAEAQGRRVLARAVCDHLAGMTDRFASQQLVAHFVPRPWRESP
jgi:dGTPase